MLYACHYSEYNWLQKRDHDLGRRDQLKGLVALALGIGGYFFLDAVTEVKGLGLLALFPGLFGFIYWESHGTNKVLRAQKSYEFHNIRRVKRDASN